MPVRARKPAAALRAANAIWSHSWYANVDDDSGPAGCLLGGYNLPGTNLWVGDYTIQPEDGGVGVFAHEFGHDLGLPDLYDTAGGPDNGTGYWTLMSSGSWASDSPDCHRRPSRSHGRMGESWRSAGSATTSRVCARRQRDVELGPAEGATRGRYQALRVDLPDISKTLTPFPVDGNDPNYFYSGRATISTT
jgi:immune inhibitor A